MLLPLGPRHTPATVRVTTHFDGTEPVSTASRQLLEASATSSSATTKRCRFSRRSLRRERQSSIAVDCLTTSVSTDWLAPEAIRARTTFEAQANRRTNDVCVYQNGGMGYIDRERDHDRNADSIDKWKVFVGRSRYGGQAARTRIPHRILGTPFVGSAGHRLYGDLSCRWSVSTRRARRRVSLSYYRDRLFALPRLAAQAITKHATRNVYTFVPHADVDQDVDGRDALHEVRHHARTRSRSSRSMIRPMDLTRLTMSKTIEEILAPKPEARPRIYAYSIDDKAHKGLLKVGQTTRDVKQRVAEQLKTAAIKNYKIELDESAERDDGTIFTDHDVRAALVKKGFANTELEWMRCTVTDVKTVLTELRTGQQFTGTHHETFAMRREQAEAVNKTHAYFHSIWKEDMHAVPRFLWNAKMRFGKTFTTYQLAKKLGAKRVLVVTFKPAVEDAWQTDLESHVDFDGWQYLSRNSDSDPTQDRPQEAARLFRLLPGPARPRRRRGTSSPRTNGSTR